ncbi:MAG: peptidase [Ruminococcaceae bacterium]|nr:peptidase [Oscillospiraceae bacterium]
MGYRYYYSVLPKEQRQVYEEMRRGLTVMAPSIRTLRLDVRTLSDILFCLRLDEPNLAFVKTASFRAVREAEHVEVLPQYAFEPKKMRTIAQTIDTRVKKIAAPARGLTEEEKLRYVHDWILDNVRYDKLYLNYAHEVIGPLCHGVGVCEGIAKTVKILLDELGMECLTVIGREDEDKHGIEGMRHAWNIVRVGGNLYHMDATFDLSATRCGVKRYDYYKLSDAQIFADHREPVWQIPCCPRGGEYYSSQRLTADSPEALTKLLTRLTKKKGAAHVFQWTAPDGSFPVEEILQICGGIAAAKGKNPAVSFNRSRRVVLFTLQENHEL